MILPSLPILYSFSARIKDPLYDSKILQDFSLVLLYILSHSNASQNSALQHYNKKRSQPAKYRKIMLLHSKYCYNSVADMFEVKTN